MAEISISSTLKVNDSAATVELNTARSLNSIVRVNDSRGELIDAGFKVQRAIRTQIRGNESRARAEIQKLTALRTTLYVNTSEATLKYNVQRAVDSTIQANTSDAKFMPTIQRAIKSLLNVNVTKAAAKINVQRAVKTQANLNQAAALLRYLFLKNPPLPPEGNGIKVRSSKPVPLRQSQLVVGVTYLFDVAVVGERLQGTHLVFTVKHAGLRGDLNPVLEKSTAGCPPEYLLLPDGGKGDIMVQSVTPVASVKGSQEMLVTILVKPDEFAKYLPRTPGTYNYEFWAYDLMGLNALLETGTFTTSTTGGGRK